MPSLRKRPDDAAPAPTPAAGTGAPVNLGKGRPTPKRTQAEAARRRPLVPTDRKAATKAARTQAREQRDREYQALQSGDERYLPARDKGPVRRWVRDTVDARWNLGEFFLPASIVLVFSTLLSATSPVAGLVVVIVLYSVVIACVVDAVLLGRRLRRGANAKFGEDKVPKGTIMYGVMRAFQMRRTRLPRPQVQRGQHPA